MNKTALYGLLIAILLPVTCYMVVKYYSASAVTLPRHYIYDSVTTKTVNGKLTSDTAWHQLPELNLLNQFNEKVNWDRMEGKTVVASFFFTHCPTICPKLTTNMKLLQDDIKKSTKIGNRDADFLQLLSITVDPERDSVGALKKWADRFQINSNNWWLLTGSKKEIYDLSINDMKLGLVDGKGIDTSFFHTDYMVLIDKNRNIRGYYHGLDTMALKQLAHDIIFLTLEKDEKRKGVFFGQFVIIGIVFLLTILGMALMFYFLKRSR
ncbi:MAG TPA: SCO family protein [Chitinophagaceae bacterium]|nr:SCO family protein [Chitinophagaceae bacterium]